MSLLSTTEPAPIDGILGNHAAGRAYMRYYDQVLSAPQLPTDILELCRLRIAQILCCDSELQRRLPQAGDAVVDAAGIARLRSWPSDPSFSRRERTFLAFAEQFVIDAEALHEDLITNVRSLIGDAGMVAFVVALGVIEQMQRVALALDAAAPPAGSSALLAGSAESGHR
jgi:alkylhydroperoxidase family enzyme